MFHEDVQYRLQFCLYHLNCDKLAVFPIMENGKLWGPSQMSRVGGR